MNWGELKTKIRDLGFEEDSTMNEYESIVRNAANRAINLVFHELVLGCKQYFAALYATKKKVVDEFGEVTYETIRWTPPSEIDYITEDTEDTEDIELPDRVIEIVPILASHYVWLDDDQVKATVYWNEYDDFRTRLFEEAQARNYNCEFYGGLWF